MYFSDLKEPSSNSLRRVRQLRSPYGLVSQTIPLYPAEGDPQFSIYTSTLDDPSSVLETQRNWSHDSSQGNFDGAGGAIDPERAQDISIVESLERYTSCSWDSDSLVFAREDELGDAAVSPSRFPQCSASELSSPEASLVTYDPRLPIRWQRAWSLTRQKEVYVPANTIYLRFPMYSRSELFTHSISTGSAAHSSIKDAVLGGLLEVIERDSISLTWLQKMRLPRVTINQDELQKDVLEYYKVANSTNLEVQVFDATTDFGVPVLDAVQLSEYDPVLSQIVAATCDIDPQQALAKIYRELSSLRIALKAHAQSNSQQGPSKGGVSVIGGAIYQGNRGRRHVFDFLLEGERPSIPLDDVGKRPAEGIDQLKWTVNQLENVGAEVIAVDITTDEARQVGMHVVKVLVPEAMPLSFVHNARYLGTRRLYDVPRFMGHTVYDEAHLNHEYQPFA